MRIRVFLLAVALIVCLSGCAAQPKGEYHRITPERAFEMMKAPHVLLDVRTEEEHALNRIPNSLGISDIEIMQRAEAELPDKDALILIYSRGGRRSTLAAYDLIEMGYTNVFDFGGIIDWPYEIDEEVLAK